MNNKLQFAGLFLAGFAGIASAQGPLYDKVTVDLPYRVTLNDTTLEPGHYTIRQLDAPGGGSRVLQIFTDNGMRLKTSALTIPALDNNTPSSTKIVLHHYGSDYYFDKVWIQGKNYGYEFPLPSAVKSREREKLTPYTVAATYEQAPAPIVESSATAPEPTVVSAAPAPAAAPEPTVAAQNTPAPAPAMAPEPASAPRPAAPVEMPHTAGNWLGMLLGGGVLTSAGALLRRFRA